MATYDVANQTVRMSGVDVQVSGAKDAAENSLPSATVADNFSINTQAPGGHVLANLAKISDATLEARP